MAHTINGKEIFTVSEIAVYAIEDNKYIVTNNNVAVVLNYLPCLNAAALRGLLPVANELDPYEVWQMNKKGNILKPTKTMFETRNDVFENWFVHQSELAEMEMQGY